MQMSSSCAPAFFSVTLPFSQESLMWPTSLAAERRAHIQARKQSILNLLVKMEHHFQMSHMCLQQGLGCPSKEKLLYPYREQCWIKTLPSVMHRWVLGLTHWPVLGAMSISGFGQEKPK